MCKKSQKGKLHKLFARKINNIRRPFDVTSVCVIRIKEWTDVIGLLLVDVIDDPLTDFLCAVFSIPYQSFYSASKASLNAFALAFRNEVKDFGIDVCCLLPGDVKIGFTAAREKNPVGSGGYPRMKSSIEAMEKDEQNRMRPEKIVSQLLRIANCRLAMVYNVSGWSYKLFCFLERLLPKTFVNWIVGKMY